MHLTNRPSPAWVALAPRSLRAGTALALAFAIGLPAWGQPGSPESSGHFDDVRKWRAERLHSLERDSGWLSLVGLYWLEPGVQTIGSDPGNDLVLPEQAPARIGVLQVTPEQVVFGAQVGVEVRHEGQPVREIVLAPDVTGEPTILELGSLSFYLIDREGQRAIRVKDRESPTLKEFQGLEYFPLSRRWRVQARYEPFPEPRELSVPTIQGPVQHLRSPGAVVFEIDGQTHSLEVIADEGDPELFIVFGDATNGGDTYGGGRFLYTDLPNEAGKVELDFNRAYNPPCVFTPFATCPLPPPQNRLPFRVAAGEKAYVGHP